MNYAGVDVQISIDSSHKCSFDDMWQKHTTGDPTNNINNDQFQ